MNNHRAFVVFVTVALLIYSSINYYVFRRIVQSASLVGSTDTALRAFLLFCILCYPLSRMPFFGRAVANGLEWVGAFWLAVVVYAVLIIIVIDFARLTDLFTGWLPNSITADPRLSARWALGYSGGLVVVLLIVGRILAVHPVVRTLEIPLARLPEGKDGYRIVEFSDIHLGGLVGIDRLNKIVDKANSLSPDLILLPGDIIDEPPRRLKWAIEPLKRLRARDGVMASMGNHDYYSGPVEAMKMFERAGILLLKDRSVVIPGTAVISGLDDVSSSREFGQKPVPVASFTSGFDPSLPMIVMHHTPMRVKEIADAGADLMISGHTHGGQLWPFDYITRAVYGVRRGLSRIGKMQLFLGVGVGTWGPPIRIGATPEIVVMVLRKG